MSKEFKGTKGQRQLIIKAKTKGKCRKCSCTHTTPCFDYLFGYCCWVDKDETLCSACSGSKL